MTFLLRSVIICQRRFSIQVYFPFFLRVGDVAYNLGLLCLFSTGSDVMTKLRLKQALSWQESLYLLYKTLICYQIFHRSDKLIYIRRRSFSFSNEFYFAYPGLSIVFLGFHFKKNEFWFVLADIRSVLNPVL